VCKEYQPFLKRTYNLTEEHDASVRGSRIFDAVEPGRITLMSSAYGRGTDIVVRNDEIKENGGLHIIHAFLSLDESEEVQIKGRTARQNGKGSYACIIDENWL
jgi:preprotein translocase subunit SecA